MKFIVAKEASIMKIIILINGVLYLCLVPFVQSPHVYEVDTRFHIHIVWN